MEAITFHTILTVFMATAFVVLILWVASGRQKKTFDEAAQLPLSEDHFKTSSDAKETKE